MYLVKLDAIDSTNSYLRQMAKKEDLGKWAAVTAEYQSDGRGQKGAVWQSERGKNMICSILVRLTDLKAKDQFLLNCAVSMGIFNALRKFDVPKLKIKWPNDIMSVSKKLGGILIENTLMGDEINQTIIGIGINVNQDHFSKDLPSAVSIKQLTGKETDRDILLQEILVSIQQQFELIFQRKYDELWRSYDQQLFRKDKAHMFEDKQGQRFMGVIKGVSQKGLLLVEDQKERVTAYNFKEISYV
jgi:BirA family biotin operon repressor/biotin-[acetyl-CoA-carboxylase] ligase